jgi:hypothetical protein
MNLPQDNIRLRTTCVALSVLTHLVLLCPLWKLGSLNFAQPVSAVQAVMVELTRPEVAPEPAVEPVARETGESLESADAASNETPADAPLAPLVPPELKSQSEPTVRTETAAMSGNQAALSRQSAEPATAAPPPPAQEEARVNAIPPPLRTAGEFLATQKEKLVYQISMFGAPFGSAELEAHNEHGEVRISLKVTSTPLVSTIYPVDDLIETRHIGGNFIITRIRQHEGSVTSDKGFTIMLREKQVFWFNRLKNRSAHESIPNDEVLDILSGLYYLRNRPLQIGKSEMLHVYDSDTYSPLPVEVLRRERLLLPGLRTVDTIVVKPLLTTDGLFKKTGEVTIWLSDDEFKVPVKMESRISLGKVTAELVSADTQKAGGTSQQVATRQKN